MVDEDTDQNLKNKKEIYIYIMPDSIAIVLSSLFPPALQKGESPMERSVQFNVLRLRNNHKSIDRNYGEQSKDIGRL